MQGIFIRLSRVNCERKWKIERRIPNFHFLHLSEGKSRNDEMKKKVGKV
jgi:hypothetical protein